jgi:hypothetical protein
MQQRGTMRLDTHLTRLLWAIAKKAGGEIRIDGNDLDDVPDHCSLVTDYDNVAHQLVIQSRSGVSETIVINRGEQWTQTNPTAPTANSQPLPASSPQPGRSAIITDETAARIEEKLLQRAAERNRQRDSAASNRAQRLVNQE